MARILLVEDEFILAVDLQCRVEALGHSVIGPAMSVNHALAILETETPDAAVLDVSLRGEFVSAVAHRLRERKTPCVLLTAYEPGQVADGGLDGFPLLQKPISDTELAEALLKLLR